MQNCTCFLIDDDADDREIFAMALEDADRSSKCVTAKNGVDALEKLNCNDKFIPDYIFLDLNMPMLSGKECLKELKKIPRLNHVPIIIYSTSSHEKDIAETKQMGASYFLTKPSSIKVLTSILTKIIEKQDSPYLLKGLVLSIIGSLLIKIIALSCEWAVIQ